MTGSLGPKNPNAERQVSEHPAILTTTTTTTTTGRKLAEIKPTRFFSPGVSFFKNIAYQISKFFNGLFRTESHADSKYDRKFINEKITLLNDLVKKINRGETVDSKTLIAIEKETCDFQTMPETNLQELSAFKQQDIRKIHDKVAELLKLASSHPASDECNEGVPDTTYKDGLPPPPASSIPLASGPLPTKPGEVAGSRLNALEALKAEITSFQSEAPQKPKNRGENRAADDAWDKHIAQHKDLHKKIEEILFEGKGKIEQLKGDVKHYLPALGAEKYLELIEQQISALAAKPSPKVLVSPSEEIKQSTPATAQQSTQATAQPVWDPNVTYRYVPDKPASENGIPPQVPAVSAATDSAQAGEGVQTPSTAELAKLRSEVETQQQLARNIKRDEEVRKQLDKLIDAAAEYTKDKTKFPKDLSEHWAEVKEVFAETKEQILTEEDIKAQVNAILDVVKGDEEGVETLPSQLQVYIKNIVDLLR